MGNQQGGAKTTFSPLHGSNVELLRDGAVATRKDKRNPTNAVLYTEQPIPVGCKFEIKLEEKAKYSFSSNLKIGFTNFVPEDSSGIAISSAKLKTRFDHWILIGSSVWNGNVHWALKYDLETLNQGDIIGCRVREGGRLCFYVNGEYKRYKCQALANITDSKPLYGFVDLCGDALRVRALPVVDRSGGKGGGYVSGGGTLKYNRTLPTKKSTVNDPHEPVETKKKSATMRLSTSTSSNSLFDASADSINHSMTSAIGGSSELMSMTSNKWKNRAFGSFHERASPSIIFKENRGVALRNNLGDSNGFVFTQEPIRIEEKFVVGLVELNGNYHCSLGIGMTLLDPSTTDIPKSSVYLGHHPDCWVAISDTLRHNGVLHKLPFNLDTLKHKSKIGMMVKFNGDLHMFLNDKDEGKICEGVNVIKPLYGFVDLAGKTTKIRSMFYSAKSATTTFKEHGKEVEELCHQMANEVVDLITIHFQTEKAANAASTWKERRTSLVEASLGRNWQTGSFTGSFSGANKDFGLDCKFTLNFMEKLQHKVQSNEKREQVTVDTNELHQSLQKSLTITTNDETKKQIFDEEDEETMRQLLNPVTGDADDLASQIVDRIPDDILVLLNVKLTSSTSLPVSATDPLESARAIILEVLVNTMSLESLDNDKSSGSKIQKEVTPSINKEPTSPSAKSKPSTVRSKSTESEDANGAASVITAQLLFSQLTTTIAHAVIEKLNMEATRNPLTTINSVSDDDGPPLPFVAKPHESENTGDMDAMPTTDDDNQEYEEHVMVVTYGSFVGNPPSKNDESHDRRKDKTADILEEASTIDANVKLKQQSSIDDCQDNNSSISEEANDTISIDQKINDTPSTNQKPNDEPLLDQRINNTASMNQNKHNRPFTDHQDNDTLIEDQKVDDTLTKDQKVSTVVDQAKVTIDQDEVEGFPEELAEHLTFVRPYLIQRSDLTCTENPEGFGTATVVKWFNSDCFLEEFNLDFATPEGKRKFGKYLSICATLSKLRHPNIQQLWGFVSQEKESTKPSSSIVTETLDLTLTELLTNHKCNEIQTTSHIRICYDVARAVSFLHSSKVSHLLIRSDCVLLTRDYHAKLSDVASSLLYQCGLNNSMKMINANYLPPEGMLPGASGTKIDIFSTGVLFLQIITHVAPNPVPVDATHRTEIQRRQDHIDLVHSSHSLLTLIITCLSGKPVDRPTDEEICNFLETLMSTQD